MRVVFYLIVFFAGLAIGSFLNCLIYRLDVASVFEKRKTASKKASFLKGRSFCPHCKHILGWRDLIPLLSFLILKGRCRYCQKKISFQYPLVELATGLIFLLVVGLQSPIFTSGGFLTALYLLLISCFLILIFVYDLKYYIIPDKIVYPAIFLAFFYNLIWAFGFFSGRHYVSAWAGIYNPLLSAFGAAAFFMLIVLFSRGRWMGLGDVKLAFFMGLFLGFPNILIALFLAFSTGAIIGIGLVLLEKKTLKSEVPFGPFLVTGTFIAFFGGQELVNWCFRLFLLE